jgi:hypothetical protein
LRGLSRILADFFSTHQAAFDKNSLWGELNVPKRELFVKRKALMITDSNHAYLVKKLGC